MAWPTGKPDTTAFDSQDDAISTARAELQTMSTSVGQMVDFIDTSGITSGQALVYDSVNDKLVAGNVSGGSGTITGGTNITVTAPDSAGFVTIDSNALENITGGSGITITSDSAGAIIINNDIANAINNVVEDTTPQLGGDLDTNGNALVDSTTDYIWIKENELRISGDIDSANDEFLELKKDGTNFVIGVNSSSGVAMNSSVNFGMTTGYITLIAENNVGTTGNFLFSPGGTFDTPKIEADEMQIDEIEGRVFGGSDLDLYNAPLHDSNINLSATDITITPKATTGRLNIVTATSTTIGANGSASALTANPVGYLKIKVNGTEYQVPYYNI